MEHPVELHTAAGDVVKATTTINGKFLFDLLDSGDYEVVITGSVFSSTGPYRDWVPAPSAQAADNDANHNIDHSAQVIGDITTDGISSGVFTLSATASTVFGASPSGDEPIGENVLGVSDPNTNDDFSNLTIDLGLLAGDADSDSIPDILEMAGASVGNFPDYDGDDISDFLDTDSDGDSISDATEAGANPSEPVDSDGDGNADYLDRDSDGDSIPDAMEGIIDTDYDGIPNWLDTDSDGDGISDTIESSLATLDTDGDGIVASIDVTQTGGLDANYDGIDDALFDTALADTDSNSRPDFLDTDSDGDNIPDAIEGTVDSDGDGSPDFRDVDSDGDGIPDSVEKRGDADNDGIPNYLDLDSDGDDLPDATEGTGDNDNDGIPNYLDPIGAVDAPGDLVLEKFVENLSEGGPRTRSNAADIGQQLRYVIVFDNRGIGGVHDLFINDSTPAFTQLAAPVTCPSMANLPIGITGCTIQKPNGAANAPGYEGPITWSFSGSLTAGASGELSFDVEVQ